MNDAQGVAVLQSVEDRSDRVSRFRLRELFLLKNLVEQLEKEHISKSGETHLTALEELHHEEVVLVVLVDLVQLDNVGVVYLFENFNFVLKANLVFFSHLASG